MRQLPGLALVVATAVGCSNPEPELPEGTTEIQHRVLAQDLREGEPHSATLINNPADLAILSGERGWEQAVDFDQEVALVFDMPESNSCPYNDTAKVGHNPETNIVYPLVTTDRCDACTADAGQHRIVLAVPTAELPAQDFHIWINSSGGHPQGLTILLIDADLDCFESSRRC